MPKLKSLSGSEVVDILKGFGFAIASQKGSHVKLQRISAGGIRQVLTIPVHKELDKGTLKAIFRQASKYILEEELRKFFYLA